MLCIVHLPSSSFHILSSFLSIFSPLFFFSFSPPLLFLADITALHAAYGTEKEDEARKKEADLTALRTAHTEAVESLVATAESKTRNTLMKDHEMALWSATKEAEARSLSDQRYIIKWVSNGVFEGGN